MRKFYLDNIRWATVLLVIIYHVFYMFNAEGVFGGVGKFSEVQYQDGLLYFVYPWFMALLFLIAGISARYALNKLSGKEFLRGRNWKLLVPSTLGLFVYQWIVGYFNIKIGGGLEMMPSFLVYPISVFSGIGPLWFAQTLWLFSLLLLWIRKIDKRDVLWEIGRKCNLFIMLLFALLVWGGAQVLNMPVITTYRFGIYFVVFLLGYFVFSHEEMQEILEKWWLPLTACAVLLGGFYTYKYFGQNYVEDAVLRSLFTNIYAWMMCLAILGCGKRWFNRQNKFSSYMTKSSFGFYVMHYLFVLVPCYFLRYYSGLPVWGVYVVGLISAFVGTFISYEIVRRIPFIRTLVLGIRRKG